MGLGHLWSLFLIGHLLNWTPTFEWYMAWLIIPTCYMSFDLCYENKETILWSNPLLVYLGEHVWSFQRENESSIWFLTIFAFHVWIWGLFHMESQVPLMSTSPNMETSTQFWSLKSSLKCGFFLPPYEISIIECKKS